MKKNRNERHDQTNEDSHWWEKFPPQTVFHVMIEGFREKGPIAEDGNKASVNLQRNTDANQRVVTYMESQSEHFSAELLCTLMRFDSFGYIVADLSTAQCALLISSGVVEKIDSGTNEEFPVTELNT